MTDKPTVRAARSRAKILQAALDLCGERPYAAVTVEAIAARAGVGKPTIYRWWPSKGAVFVDALLDVLGERFFLYPDTGDIRADLRTWARSIVEVFTDEFHRRILTGVIGSAQHDPELAAMLHDQVYATLADRNRDRIRSAIVTGDLPPLDPEFLDDLIVAPLWLRLLVSGAPLTPHYADRVVQAAIAGAIGEGPPPGPG